MGGGGAGGWNITLFVKEGLGKTEYIYMSIKFEISREIAIAVNFVPSFYALLNLFLQRLVIIRVDHGSKGYHKSRKYLLFE